MLIGLDFLGIDFKIRKGKQNSCDALPSIRTRKRKLRQVPTSPKDSIMESETKLTQNHVENEEDDLKCESTGKDWSLTEQTAVTKNASVKMTGDREGSKKTKDDRKSFFLFGETEFNGCTFKRGYLKSLPKNKPIPDECFGCPQILECIALSGNK
jgi:hypothetical protein